MLDTAYLIKMFPIAGFIIAGCIGYGQIQADIRNLQTTQTAQFEQIQHQLDNIQDRLNLK